MRFLLPLLVACAAAPEPVLPPGWTTAAPMPSPRQEHAVVAFRGEVWALGGFEGAIELSARVEAYDPTTDTWRRTLDLPTPMHHLHVAVIHDELIVAGLLEGMGFDHDGRVFRLRDEAEGWVDGTPMPEDEARGSGGVAVLDGGMHIVGGFREIAVPTVSVYDPTTDTWSRRPDLPEPKDHLAAGVIDGTLIAAAGRDARLTENRNTTARLVDGSWVDSAPLARARGGVVSVTHDGLLYVLGGEGNREVQDGMFADVEAYDPDTDTWTLLGDMPIPVHGAGAASLEGAIWIPGGGTRQLFGATDVLQRFVP